MIDTLTTLPVMEAFYTLQGEGVYQGRAAYFIRLGGCDVGCHWCDVKESWDINAHPQLAVTDIVAEASRHQARLAVITGGEPLMHDLAYMCQTLKEAGFRRHIETAGVYPISGEWDWICFSPKKFKKPLPAFYEISNELKIVIYHPSDIAWAEGFARQMNPSCALLLQPEWSKSDTILPLLIDYVKANPHWRVSLQTHKFMHIA